MITTLITLFAAVASVAAVHPPAHAERCGIVISVPSRWKALWPKTNGDVCSFVLQPRDWARARRRSRIELPEAAMTVTVMKKPLSEAAQKYFMTVGEERRRQGDDRECEGMSPETWLLPGGRGSRICEQAIEVSAGEFRGIAGQSSYGRMEKSTGHYAGLGEWYAGAVSNGTVTVLVEDGSESGFEEIFLPVMRSIRSRSVGPPN